MKLKPMRNRKQLLTELELLKGTRLASLAKFINDRLPGYVAKIEPGYCNTDRKVGRLRIPGRGRNGNKLVVRKNGEVVFDHNAAETYRKNSEVVNWIEGRIVGRMTYSERLAIG